MVGLRAQGASKPTHLTPLCPRITQNDVAATYSTNTGAGIQAALDTLEGCNGCVGADPDEWENRVILMTGAWAAGFTLDEGMGLGIAMQCSAALALFFREHKGKPKQPFLSCMREATILDMRSCAPRRLTTADAETNQGMVSDDELKKLLGDAASKGIFFTIVGIGLE